MNSLTFTIQATKALLGLTSAGIVVRIIYIFITEAAEEGGIHSAIKRAKRVIIAGICALCAEAFILAIQSYFL